MEEVDRDRQAVGSEVGCKQGGEAGPTSFDDRERALGH